MCPVMSTLEYEAIVLCLYTCHMHHDFDIGLVFKFSLWHYNNYYTDTVDPLFI